MSKGPEHGKGRSDGSLAGVGPRELPSIPSQDPTGASGFDFGDFLKRKSANLIAAGDSDMFIENDFRDPPLLIHQLFWKC